MERYSRLVRGFNHVGQMARRSARVGRVGVGMLSTLAAVSLVSQGVAQGQGYDIVPPLPAGVVPVPSSPMPQAPTSGQQFVVFVNDTSEATLRQVQMVEPTAFRTTIQGQPVIQAGRFNHSANAQMRVSDLASQGISAQMSTAPAAQPIFAQTPALPTNVYAATGSLPPLPGVTVIPPGGSAMAPLPTPTTQMPPVSQTAPSGNVEFGQQLAYAAPASPANSYPVNMSPPPSSSTAMASPAEVPGAPYYVVIPTSESNLQSLSAQIIQLGTPADRVQMRTAPRGPHVAVGPFADRGLANQWNNFYRDAGLSSSRVFFQR